MELDRAIAEVIDMEGVPSAEEYQDMCVRADWDGTQYGEEYLTIFRDELIAVLRKLEPGKDYPLTIIRMEKEITLRIAPEKR